MRSAMALCQVALSSMDIARSVHWYRRTFNWKTAGEKREREGEAWARVPGLPEAHFTVLCLVEQHEFFQYEMFEFQRPRMRLQPADALPNDIGYSTIGMHVPDFDRVLRQITGTGGQLLTDPLGA